MNDDLFYRNTLKLSKCNLELITQKAEQLGYSSLDEFTKQLLLNYANDTKTYHSTTMLPKD